MEEQNEFFHILSFSMFSDVKGPVPVYCYPNTISELTQVEIAMKSVSLLMGEAVYQAGLKDDLKYFGILPFPDLNYIGLTYFFLIPDELARGKSKAATVTIVVEESNHHFIYDNIHTLRILLDKCRVKLRRHNEPSDIKTTLDSLRSDIHQLYTSPHTLSIATRRKIVLAGLDEVGKSSFLKAIRQQFFDVFEDSPPTCISHDKNVLRAGITVQEWNVGTHGIYNINHMKNANLYLHDVDLLFYLVDIQQKHRLDDALTYLSQILDILDLFKNSPTIEVVLHKYDPDLKETTTFQHYVADIQTTILKLYGDRDMKIFNTSIFDPASINTCFSYALSRVKPNQSEFVEHIKEFLEKNKGHFGLLMTANALILGEYSSNAEWQRVLKDLRSDTYDLFKATMDPRSVSHSCQSLYINGLTIVFYRFFIDSFEYYLVFDTQKPQKKQEKWLKKFEKLISPLLEDYLRI